MGYYLRAFCRSDELPPLRPIVEWAAKVGIDLELDVGSALLDDAEWREAEIRYNADKQPFVVEVSRASGGDELLPRAVVGAQLSGDIDDDGNNAVGTFLSYFVEHCEAMIQADGEGFSEGDRVLVELEH